jgi:hypothetical protein
MRGIFYFLEDIISCKSSCNIWFGSRTSGGGAGVEPLPEKWLQLEEYVHEELVKDDFSFSLKMVESVLDKIPNIHIRFMLLNRRLSR